jgi:hypothetical protein
MRKTLVVVSVAVLALVLVSGVALAHGGMWDRGRGGFYCGGPGYMNSIDSDNDGSLMTRGYRGQRMDSRQEDGFKGMYGNTRGFRSQEIPDELKDQVTEMQKIRLDMRREMLEEEPDLDLMKQLHEKMQEVRNEISDWHFDNYLKSLNSSETSN